MPFSSLEVAPIARTLAQLTEQKEDICDLYLEHLEQVELPPWPTPGLLVRQESGLALRLVQGGSCWLGGHDGISSEAFQDLLRKVVRRMPRLPFPHLDLGPAVLPAPPENAAGLSAFALELESRLRREDAAVVPRARVVRYRRALKVVSPSHATGTESELYYGVQLANEKLEEAAGTRGRAHLFTRLDGAAAEVVALSYRRAFAARVATFPGTFRGSCVLGAEAVAVFLHEAIAHALEADVLARGGEPEAAIGVPVGSSLLHVFDDPAGAPEGVRRAWDDEGAPALRRYLVRGGIVEQPLADKIWAKKCEHLLPGAGRRGHRYDLVGPRSYHLELAPGESSLEELFAAAEGGLYLPEAEGGHLDPLSGEFELRFPWGQRIAGGGPAHYVGACRLRGRVGAVLERIAAVGREAMPAGSGWCAKGGARMPVWATAPPLLLDGVELLP